MSMRSVALAPGADLDGFRAALRALMADGVPPESVAWSMESSGDLFGAQPLAPAPPVHLPRGAAELIRAAICHSDPERYALLYRLAWRITHGEPKLMEIASDPLVHRLERMRKSVRRDIHKMHAFLRFRCIETPDGARYVAWFEPDHFILDAALPFFVDRFASLVWSILTPIGSRHWDGTAVTKGAPAQRNDAPESDAFEAGWRTYFESTFNPARLNPRQMLQEMPKKYWKNMPETAAIHELIRKAPTRVDTMLNTEAEMSRKRDPIKAVAAMSEQTPETLDALNAIIRATPPFVAGAERAVLGEGPLHPPIAFVGEQPGDEEDLKGRPFVGPAGRLLDEALGEAGIDREACYLTNAVKHFKFEQRGKRRLHKSPTAGEIKHYRWWLMREMDLVAPRLIVSLGASAALALTGKAVSVTRERGPASFENRPGLITVHPSYLLRLPDANEKAAAYAAFVADLRQAQSLARAAA